MINLEISNYVPPFDYLNGTKTQNITPFHLARAMVMVGRGSWSDVYSQGIFRIGELICKALAHSKIENGNLVMQDSFYNLNQSEKATISYYFGQALTKLYSEKHFNIKWLFHVDDFASQIAFHVKGTATPKTIIGKTKKTGERPDLIGLVGKNDSHIFEAKGNSGGYDKGVMQHAINQVSQINNYNGVAPLTRAACYYNLSEIPIKGIIIDPEGEKGMDIEFDEEEALLKYYEFFKKNSESFNNNIRYGNHEYLITPVGVPNVYFGFDKRILKLQPSQILKNGFYNDIIESNSNSSEFTEISLGLDGIILVNK